MCLCSSEDKKIDKVKVLSATIITTGSDVRPPYYEIKYVRASDKECCIGYGSYELSYVQEWLETCFEIVDEV